MVEYTPTPGTRIQRVCSEALAKAKAENTAVRFTFNGKVVVVEPHHDFRDIARQLL